MKYPLHYDFKTPMVAGIGNSVPYDGPQIEGIASNSSRAGFRDVEVVCGSGPKCNYDEAASFIGAVAHRRPSTGVVTSNPLLQYSVSARSTVSSSVAFCSEKDIIVPRPIAEAFPMVQQWCSRGQEIVTAARLGEDATLKEAVKTAEVTTDFEQYKKKTEEVIAALK